MIIFRQMKKPTLYLWVLYVFPVYIIVCSRCEAAYTQIWSGVLEYEWKISCYRYVENRKVLTGAWI